MSDREIAVKMTVEEWDVVIHALEEEMDQLLPPGEEEAWIGSYPGEEDAVAIGEVYEKIFQSVQEGSA